MNANKARGPDGICGRILKECGTELAPVWRKIFQWSINCHTKPAIWKTSNVIPLRKKPQPSVLNDYRPVALTPIVIKCFERIRRMHILHTVKPVMDTRQYTYRTKRGVEDATLMMVNSIYQHLDKSGNYVRVLMVDFSSAFNTIQPHLMIDKLLSLGVNNHIVLWVHQFLTRRPQRVCLGEVLSDTVLTNTGHPQGCVLSPVLFTIYTNDCRSMFNNCDIIKYADDTAIVGRLSKCATDLHSYTTCVEQFTT